MRRKLQACVRALAWLAGVFLLAANGWAQDLSGRALYDSLKKFELDGKAAQVNNLVFKRDRVEMTLNGTVYFAAPVNGRVFGAVFLGQGTLRAETPPTGFERDNLRRLLKAEVLESDFATAVFRFSDDTFDTIGRGAQQAAAPSDAVAVARDFEPRMLKETGVNVSARLAVGILNQDTPGVFLAQFDKGRRDRFTLVLDYQSRILVSGFDIGAGEKGLIFKYDGDTGPDVWMAFYGLDDYRQNRVAYPDVFDLASPSHYEMRVDLRESQKALRLGVTLNLETLADGVRAIPFAVNDGLDDDERMKYAMRLTGAQMGGAALEAAQEQGETGVTLFLPAAKARGEKFTVELQLEGDFLYDTQSFAGGQYPRSNSSWYPRLGYLRPSTFDLTFLHPKNRRVSASGRRIREEADPESKDNFITQYKIEQPVALVTFGMGPFERHQISVKLPSGRNLPVEFSSLSSRMGVIKEDFILQEMDNAVRFFSDMFGDYPYPTFGATFHPFGFGQGFATMLLIPDADRATTNTFAFLAHETSHQWWGNMVAWRSYRDQWLSEGFAEYSGVLYTGLRDTKSSQLDLLKEMRGSLTKPPRTVGGIGSGRLVDVGPVILGHRVSTRKTLGAYQALIYNKGALILRMLHFLFTDPVTGDGTLFFDMMGEFVKRNRNRSASTDSFVAVANEFFPRAPISRRLNAPNLNWFFDQYVYRTELPSYSLTYQIEYQSDRTAILRGEIQQSGVPENWLAFVPVVLHYPGGRSARVVIGAAGPRTNVAVGIPGSPTSVELDPELWTVSEKTEARVR
jgi:hypothetical protein